MKKEMYKIGMILLSSVILVIGENVSLSGIVKKSGSSVGLAGVRISLAKIPTLYDTTDVNGKFIITGNTAVKVRKEDFSKANFCIRGREIIFTYLQKNNKGSIEIFSIKGERVFYAEILPPSKQSVRLPNVSDGVGVIRI